MASKISAYVDCVSPYSYFALIHLLKNRETLATHGVEVDIIPVFLGGINQASGNKPPWTLEAKANYSPFDIRRSKHHYSVPTMKVPEFFPIVSLLPQRALAYIKTAYPDVYIRALLAVFSAMWEAELDMSKPELLSQALGKVLDEEKTRDALEKAGSPAWKAKLNEYTKDALEKGAFGCPWLWVRNRKGNEEPFFGSDRFHFIWEFLELPWKDVELLPANENTGALAKAKM